MENKMTNNPLEHTANVKKEFSMLIDHLRRDVELMDDEKAKMLFEVSAEVISGLQKSFEDYEQEHKGVPKDIR
jgi:hypothetical protein